MATKHAKENAPATLSKADGASGPPGAHDLRTFSYDVSEAIAPTWASRRAEIEETVAAVRAWLLRELGCRPGETVLELAAGVGDTGFEAAKALGADGRLISTDFSPAMVAEARRRGAELGLDNVDYRVIDAERIDLGDDSVDGVICRFGYMLMADPAQALAESRRVLRPAGRLVLAVWGPPERNPFFAVLGATLAQRGHIPPPDPSGPGIFAMGSSERTRSLLEGAGFGEARVEEVPTSFTVAGIDEYLRFVGDTAGPIALALRHLSATEREVIGAEVASGFAPFATDAGYEIPGVALVAVAS